MKVEQFVMAYKAEQDRLRAMLHEGFESLRPVLRINAEIRDCQFKWNFTETSTGGISVGGKFVPAFPTECEVQYPNQPLTAENAAEIECRQVLGSYTVIFERL